MSPRSCVDWDVASANSNLRVINLKRSDLVNGIDKCI